MSKAGALQLLLFLFSRGIAMGVWISEVILLCLGDSLEPLTARLSGHFGPPDVL